MTAGLRTAYSVFWPDAPHRVLRSAIAPSSATTGNVDAMALYAGESVANVTSVQPAAEIVAELADGAERLLRAR